MSYTAYLQQLHRPDVSVAYSCSLCHTFSPLRHLYFCADCQLLLCPGCTDAHIDGLFCPSCLTSVFSSSAQSSLGRCDQCVECPSCSHTLQTAYHSSTQLYSLVCPACRWLSYDRRQPTSSSSSLCASDVTVLLAAVRARETDEAARSEGQRLAAQLKQRLKAVAQERRQLQDRQLPGSAAISLLPSSSNASSSLTSTSLFASAAASFRPTTEMSGLQRFLVLEELVEQQRCALTYHQPFPSSTSVSFPPVPPHFKGHFPQRPREQNTEEEKQARDEGEQVYGPHDMSPLRARLSHPTSSLQSVASNTWMPSREAHPRRRALLSKLAHRCPQCTKYVIKPGPGAAKIAFEIQHTAFSFVPRMTVGALPTSWSVGKAVRILSVPALHLHLSLELPPSLTPHVYLKNPMERDLRVRLRPVTAATTSALQDPQPSEGAKRAVEEEKKEEGDPGPVTAPLQASVWSTCLPSTASCAVSVLDEWVHLPAYDDISEDSVVWQDTEKLSSTVKDHPQLVASRTLSKVGLYVTVTPLQAQTSLQVHRSATQRIHSRQFGLMVDVESDEATVSSSGYSSLRLDTKIELGIAPG